jgi:hypothetical protein
MNNEFYHAKNFEWVEKIEWNSHFYTVSKFVMYKSCLTN